MTASFAYLEELYRQWQTNEASVDPHWDDFFRSQREAIASPVENRSLTYKQSRVDSLLWAYRDVGYLHAKLNPLLDELPTDTADTYEGLGVEDFGLSGEDLDLVFSAGTSMRPSRAPLRAVVQGFRETYCSSIGVEFLHIQDKRIRKWLIDRMESTRNKPSLTAEQKRVILDDLITAEEFEHFLHTTFIGQKRFSLEGAEVVIPALHFLVNSAHNGSISDIVIGMTHRGRLTVLNRILNMPPAEIFAAFQDNHSAGMYGGSGDVKYHLGYSTDHSHPDGSSVHVTLVANPSHLESVGPVVAGKTRAVQDRRMDTERSNVLPIILHGDAAFSGQGVVAEVFNLSQLEGYRTGGTIHIIVNTQIGFTTSTRDARSTFFPTDVAKIMPVPVFHVNGDRPESVLHAVALALQLRQTFQIDVVVDIFCYRRHGHNEGDEPSFTHPKMYKLIEEHQTVGTLYGAACDRLGISTEDDRSATRATFRGRLKDASKDQQTRVPEPDAFKGSGWTELERAYSWSPVETGVSEESLRRTAELLTKIPDGFRAHPKLRRILGDREKQVKRDAIDWATAEGLAFGSLLAEGISVRLSGQDSARGTFSQRHSVWWDYESEEPASHVPLNALGTDRATFSVHDSPLSEYSVLGFEYGSSLSQPTTLVLWEAQFGDFCNGGQVIIDNYLVSAEAKWYRSSGLVLLLPHGFEGQGPEHSSAHLERFLQLCANDNIEVCVPTTPAQYFHVLRRQMLRRFRKPLVLMTPKSLLRHPRAVSSFADLSSSRFMEVVDDPPKKPANAVAFCTGKVYYDLLSAREDRRRDDVAIVRLEQIHPFPVDALKEILKAYEKTQHITWAQEEPANRGAWTFVSRMFDVHFPKIRLRYAGRPASASTATGSFKQHQLEQQNVVDDVYPVATA